MRAKEANSSTMFLSAVTCETMVRVARLEMGRSSSRTWSRPAVPAARVERSPATRAVARGETLPPHDALPLYVRDKVARTTAEREQPPGVTP